VRVAWCASSQARHARRVSPSTVSVMFGTREWCPLVPTHATPIPGEALTCGGCPPVASSARRTRRLDPTRERAAPALPETVAVELAAPKADVALALAESANECAARERGVSSGAKDVAATETSRRPLSRDD
jgi:hypothetical protein